MYFVLEIIVITPCTCLTMNEWNQSYTLSYTFLFLDDHHNDQWPVLCRYENFSLPNAWWLQNGEANGGLDRINRLHIRLGKRIIKTPIRRQLPGKLKPFAGSAYWCLTKACASYIHTFIKNNHRFTTFFRKTGNSDEVFFQTIVMNSPFSDKIIDSDLTYTDWLPNSPSPKILNRADIKDVISSSCWFARKFDAMIDSDVLDLLDAQVCH